MKPPRRHKRWAAPPQPWLIWKQELFVEQRGCCAHCRAEFDYRDLTVHHVIPQSKGSGHDKSNLALLCRHCHDLQHQS